MTDEVKKQTVVDNTEGVAQPTPAVDGAQQDDLDALLNQFTEGTKPVSQPETKVETPTNEPPVWAKELQQRYFQEELKKVTDEVFDGFDIPEKLKRIWIEGLAITSPKLGAEFASRGANPSRWNSVVKGLKREAAEHFSQFKKVDPDATADRNAVAAAVRGASTKPSQEPPPNLGRMSDAELRRYTMENFGFS